MELLTKSDYSIDLLQQSFSIFFLNFRKFDVKLGNYSDLDRAYGRATRVMIDEHLYW